MKDSNYCDYVFLDSFRIIIKWLVPVIALFWISLSFHFMWIVIIDVTDRTFNAICAVVCALLGILIALTWKQRMITISLKYTCNDNIIQNHSSVVRSFVDIKLPTFISATYIVGVTRAPWSQGFYLLSNKPIQYVSNHEGNGARVVQSLVKKGVVVLPQNKETQSIVERLTPNSAIPVYPKVAYIQR